jgi:hypothetical protein
VGRAGCRCHAVSDGDPLTGQPLCGECFDYRSAALFNASVPALWAAFTRALPAVLARELGITRAALRAHLRVSFGKVIGYQHRGLIHVHAVIRLAGPGGAGDPAPPWADTTLLRDAVLAAGSQPAVTLPHPGGSTLTLA